MGDAAVGDSDPGLQGFVWRNGTISGLGYLPGISNSRAFAISADGLVITGNYATGSGSDGLRWDHGVLRALEFGDSSESMGLVAYAGVASGDGKVVYGTRGILGSMEMLRWAHGTVSVVGHAPAGCMVFLSGGSADGVVVVGTLLCNRGNPSVSSLEGIVWTATTGIQRVTDLLDRLAIHEAKGWTIQSANAVSADGRFVVGAARHQSDMDIAYVADLAPTSIGGRIAPFLAFPLRDLRCGRSPCTETTAPITAVLDHSGTPIDRNEHTRRVTWYQEDGVVEAYTGEKGDAAQNCRPGVGRMSSTRAPFKVTENYVGARCGGTASILARTRPELFLNYDGHSGYDFKGQKFVTRVYAAADGVAYIPRRDPVSRHSDPVLALSKFYPLVVEHPNGLSTWYLHLGDDRSGKDYRLVRCPGQPTEILLKPGDRVPVTEECQIGRVGDRGVRDAPHLHFEVRDGDIVVDPFSDRLWKAAN